MRHPPAIHSVVALAATFAALLWACDSRPRPSAEPASLASGWTRRVAAPQALTEVAATAIDGRVWVAGGLDAGGNAVATVSIFDPASDTWTAGPTLPEPVHHAALVFDGSDVWLIGGYGGPGFDQPSTAVLTVQGRNWREGPALPAGRAAGAAAWDGNRLVYAGGVAPGGVTSDVLAFTDGAWRRLGNLAEGREHLAATSDGAGSAYVLGGRQGGLEGNRATVEVVTGSEVRRLGEVPTPRGGVAAFWWPGLGACLIGGESPGGTNPQVECIDAAGTLRALPNLTEARHGLGAAVVDGVVYVVAGGTQPGLFVSDTVEALKLP